MVFANFPKRKYLSISPSPKPFKEQTDINFKLLFLERSSGILGISVNWLIKINRTVTVSAKTLNDFLL